MIRLIGKPKLIKLQKKNVGNNKLVKAIDKLISDIENAKWISGAELSKDRPDADLVHNDGFYFFNISLHRTMILIEFGDQEATVVWTSTHDEYESIFKNNKNTIARWLRSNEYLG